MLIDTTASLARTPSRPYHNEQTSGSLRGSMAYRRLLEDRHGPRRGFAHRDRDEVLVEFADQPVLP